GEPALRRLDPGRSVVVRPLRQPARRRRVARASESVRHALKGNLAAGARPGKPGQATAAGSRLDRLARLADDRLGGGFLADAPRPRLGVLGDGGPGVVVDGEDLLRLEELDRPDGVVGAHRVVVADGQDGQVHPLLADQPHVAEKARVGRVVDLLAALAGDQKAAGVAAVAAVWHGGAVEGHRHLPVAERVPDPAAVLLAVGLDALLRQPLADLVVADDGGPGAPGDGDGVADVVAVAVRDEDEVGLGLVCLQGGGGVAGEERVDQHLVPARFQQKGSVTEPGDAGGHRGSPAGSWVSNPWSRTTSTTGRAS